MSATSGTARAEPTIWRLADDERDRALSDDPGRVGREKSVVYLPLHTIRDVLCADPESLAADAASKRLSALLLGPCECCIKSGALCVLENQGLAALLANASDVLTNGGWPAEPEAFVRAVAAEWVELNDPVLPTVRRAFGDPLGR